MQTYIYINHNLTRPESIIIFLKPTYIVTDKSKILSADTELIPWKFLVLYLGKLTDRSLLIQQKIQQPLFKSHCAYTSTAQI